MHIFVFQAFSFIWPVWQFDLELVALTVLSLLVCEPEHMDPALCVFSNITGPPLYGVRCPDWITLSRIPQNVFSLLLNEQRKERQEMTEPFNTYSSFKIHGVFHILLLHTSTRLHLFENFGY